MTLQWIKERCLYVHDGEGLIKEAIKSCNMGNLRFCVAGLDLKNLSCSLFFHSLTKCALPKINKNTVLLKQTITHYCCSCVLPANSLGGTAPWLSGFVLSGTWAAAGQYVTATAA